MSYVTNESITAFLGADWAKGGDSAKAVLLANAWLKKQYLQAFNADEVPEPVLAAGAYVAQEVANGAMYQGRTTDAVASSSVKVGSLSTSKTFATDKDSKAITAGEQAALSLIEPYIMDIPLFLTTEVY